mgnify:CR=1 FL=1
MFTEILNAAEHSSHNHRKHPDLPLIIDIDTFIDGHINQYVDKYFNNLGYNTEESVCRLQGTLPGTEYKIHKDTPSKILTLLIYVKGDIDLCTCALVYNVVIDCRFTSLPAQMVCVLCVSVRACP